MSLFTSDGYTELKPWIGALRAGCAVITLVMLTSLFVAGQTGHAGGLVRAPLDKILHFGFWFVCASTTQATLWTHRTLLKWALIWLLLLSGTDELIQIWTAGRHADLGDALMNVLGVGAATLAGCKIRRELFEFGN